VALLKKVCEETGIVVAWERELIIEPEMLVSTDDVDELLMAASHAPWRTWDKRKGLKLLLASFLAGQASIPSDRTVAGLELVRSPPWQPIHCC
jgi:hypothetical protein